MSIEQRVVTVTALLFLPVLTSCAATVAHAPEVAERVVIAPTPEPRQEPLARSPELEATEELTPFQTEVFHGIRDQYPIFLNCYDEPLRRGLNIHGRVVYGFQALGDGAVRVTVHQQHPLEGPGASVVRAVAQCIGRHLGDIRVNQTIPATAEPFFYPFVFNV